MELNSQNKNFESYLDCYSNLLNYRKSNIKSKFIEFNKQSIESKIEQTEFNAEYSPRALNDNNTQQNYMRFHPTMDSINKKNSQLENAAPTPEDYYRNNTDRASPDNNTLDIYESGIIGQHKYNGRKSSLTMNKSYSNKTKVLKKTKSKSSKRKDFNKEPVSINVPSFNTPRDQKTLDSSIASLMHQTHHHSVYSPEQLKKFSNAVVQNSSSMVAYTNQSNDDQALKIKDSDKNKLQNKKLLHKKSNKKAKKAQELTRNINEQYQQDKYNYRNQQKGQTSVSRRLSRKHETNNNSSRTSKLPYGLRTHLQNMTAEKEDNNSP